MKRKIISLSNLKIECYLPDVAIDNSEQLVLISLGIPRSGPNNKLYKPGVLFTALQNRLAELGINSCIVGVPGMGASEGDTFNSNLEQRADLIGQYLKKHPASNVWLVGYSMGAAVILLLLQRNMDNINGVTLIAPASYPLGAENKMFGTEFKNELHHGAGNKLCYPKYFQDLPEHIDTHLLAAQCDNVIPEFISQSFKTALECRKNKGARTHFTQIRDASHNLTDGALGLEMLLKEITVPINRFSKYRPRI